jgi:hypothetical protein
MSAESKRRVLENRRADKSKDLPAVYSALASERDLLCAELYETRQEMYGVDRADMPPTMKRQYEAKKASQLPATLRVARETYGGAGTSYIQARDRQFVQSTNSTTSTQEGNVQENDDLIYSIALLLAEIEALKWATTQSGFIANGSTSSPSVAAVTPPSHHFAFHPPPPLASNVTSRSSLVSPPSFSSTQAPYYPSGVDRQTAPQAPVPPQQQTAYRQQEDECAMELMLPPVRSSSPPAAAPLPALYAAHPPVIPLLVQAAYLPRLGTADDHCDLSWWDQLEQGY